MKRLSGKTLRAVICVLIIVFADLLDGGDSGGFVSVAVRAVCAALLLHTAYSMLKERYEQVENKMMGTIGRFIMAIFAPMTKRMSHKAYRNSSFVKGTDRYEYAGIQKRRRKREKQRLKKIDLDSTDDTKEKVRLTYAKYILTLAERGKELSLSQTPYEIDDKLDTADDKDLFDTYVDVRYRNTSSVGDAEADRCVEILEKLG